MIKYIKKESDTMYRNTYVEVNLKNIEDNIKTIISKYNNYSYYFGVVKADCYGHNDIKTIESIIKGGCNYLTTATLEEALSIREHIKDIPILVFGIIKKEHISTCIENNITITINSLHHLNEILSTNHNNLKVHIKINSGMNRLGINNKEEFNQVYSLIKESNLILEGLYTHMHSPHNKEFTDNQIKTFKDITSNIDYKDIPIIHLGASEFTDNYKKLDYVNGCRLGIIMYGLCPSTLNLKSTFKLYSEVIAINEVKPNETVGYNANYLVTNPSKIAVISIGYADGIIRKNTNRDVFINNKRYKIVGNICMDMLFVLVDDTVTIGDKVEIIKDNSHILEISDHLETIPYEVICSISKRVPRVYIK